mgnify:CR=1 FL=1
MELNYRKTLLSAKQLSKVTNQVKNIQRIRGNSIKEMHADLSKSMVSLDSPRKRKSNESTED